MDDTTLARIVSDFWKKRIQGIYFPQEWAGHIDMNQAYKIQLGILDRRIQNGAKLVGWKVGLTSQLMQEQFKVSEPVFGNVAIDAENDGFFSSPKIFKFQNLIKPSIENEICFRLNKDLTGPAVKYADANAAIEEVIPAIEIPETRGDFTKQLTLAVADNSQQKAIVLGKPHKYKEIELNGLKVRVYINGLITEEGNSENVMGDPVLSLIWLANTLFQFGRILHKDELIMTGSTTRQIKVSENDRVLTDFGSLGAVEVKFQ
tara:strand:- start:925 stop:1707 length:783 start_codon:yes stop_codon:yes gene_type:complete